MKVSLVMPVLNESKRIAQALRELAEVPDLHEVIVVDGQSSDDTWQQLQAFSRIRAMRAETGRAAQMNAGAALATGDVLLFLHADVSLPKDAVRWVRDTLKSSSAVAGAFRTWTVDHKGRWFSPLLHLADLRSRLTTLPYGDQALFVRADVFRQVGGFPEIALMEEIAFCRRIRRLGRICIVPARVFVSGRRFLAQPLRQTLFVNAFPTLYRLGVSPKRLARLYGNPR